MAEMIKAFISSTFQDLKQHRAQVVEQLHNLGIFVDPMENWSSTSAEPKEFSQGRVEGCDLCILLVAFRRGFIPDEETLSITQMEYYAAVERNIPVLPFLLKDDVDSWPPRFCENDPGIRHWRDHLQKQHGVGWFTEDPKSLDIGPAVMRWLMEKSAKTPSSGAGSDNHVVTSALPNPEQGDGWCDLGDFSIRLQGLFDRNFFPSNEEAVAHLLVEVEIRRNNLARSLDVPAEICLMLDVSNSMRKENRIDLLQEAVAKFFHQLGAKDRAAIIIFSATSQIVCGFTPAATLRSNVNTILDQMRNASCWLGLETNFGPALNHALELLQALPNGKGSVKRIYVLTDGGFYDAQQASSLLPKVFDSGTQIGIYGLGTKVRVAQLQHLLRGQRGGWVKPIANSSDMEGKFAHIARVSKAIVGQEGRLFVDFDKRITLGDAWNFRPHEHYFGAIGKRRGNCNVVAPEANRVYSMMFEIGLPKAAHPSTPVARIGFVWRNGKKLFTHDCKIHARREPLQLELDPSEACVDRVRNGYVVLDALRRELNQEEQLDLERARLQIAEYEGRSGDLVRAIQKKIANLCIVLGQAEQVGGKSNLVLESEDDLSLVLELEDDLELSPQEILADKSDWDSGISDSEEVLLSDSDEVLRIADVDDDDEVELDEESY